MVLSFGDIIFCTWKYKEALGEHRLYAYSGTHAVAAGSRYGAALCENQLAWGHCEDVCPITP